MIKGFISGRKEMSEVKHDSVVEESASDLKEVVPVETGMIEICNLNISQNCQSDHKGKLPACEINDYDNFLFQKQAKFLETSILKQKTPRTKTVPTSLSSPDSPPQ